MTDVMYKRYDRYKQGKKKQAYVHKRYKKETGTKRAFGKISLTLFTLPGHFHVIFGMCFIVRTLFSTL